MKEKLTGFEMPTAVRKEMRKFHRRRKILRDEILKQFEVAPAILGKIDDRESVKSK